ncbi:MAG: nucleotidyltransferase family protein [Nocardioidaceae bacterium]
MSGSARAGVAAAGLVLAAGSGSRLGQPKALVAGADGVSWLAGALAVLRGGGCQPLYVVVGASSEEVRREVPPDASVVVAEDWAEGMGASLRAGLRALTAQEAEATTAVVMLVDTPDVTPDVVQRLLAPGLEPQALRRSSYHGIPGHPVVIGRDHWAGVIDSAHGDRGARDYLAAHAVAHVECADLASGADIDTAHAFAAWQNARHHHAPH